MIVSYDLYKHSNYPAQSPTPLQEELKGNWNIH